MTKERFEDNKRLIALHVLKLKNFSNEELAAFHLALQNSGHISQENCGYQRALEEQLIKENGAPSFDLDLCQYAAAWEVDRRRSAGTF